MRAARQELADLLTPITKGWGTDVGVELTSLAVQIHGGMGYIEETGVAQHYRDARIAPIYEGTNGIQAIDLVGRKLPMRGGAPLTELLNEVADTAAGLRAAGLEREADSLDGATAAVREAVTAAGHGCQAAMDVEKWLEEQHVNHAH